MAQRTLVQWVDDLDGDQAVETVAFGLDGVDYELDLSAANAAALRETLADYRAHARRRPRSGSRSGTRGGRSGRGARRAPGPTSPGREQSRAVREWARRNGYTIGDRGRIPDEITDAYHQRAGTEAAPPGPTSTDTGAHPHAGGDAEVTVGTHGAGQEADGGGPAPVGLDGLTVEDREAIRGWAQQEGIEVKPRGRLSRDLIANYHATQARLG